MVDISEAYKEFQDDVLRTAEISGDLKESSFFELYRQAAMDNGDISDIEYCPVINESKMFKIDGYWFVQEQGELTLVVNDFNDDPELQSLNAGSLETLFRKVERFFKNAVRPEFINNLDEVSPTFQAAYLIYSSLSSIRRVRVVVFSNARMAVRKELVTMKEVEGKKFSFSILDFQRYLDIENSRHGFDNIEIDFEEISGSTLPCLQAHSGTDEYASYLVVVPGALLAQIYGLYGARLLEQNVRTFLQARTKVNKGIIKTLITEPSKFFAYNNGLTATASDIELIETSSGTKIKSIKDFQIVNGGQTTASILYAQDKEKTDLNDVYVQMKLSVVRPELVEEIVPFISRYANTQNKVNEADFFSSSAYHLEMEKISRRLSAPPKEGSLLPTKWFYERARGQYKDKQAYMSKAARNKFQAEYPKDQMLDKTEHAKYEMTFYCMPDEVSKGAQKCFLAFADQIEKKWEKHPELFGEGYFKDSMVRVMIFRWTDKMVAKSEWYKLDRGHKAPTVTYTLAVVAHLLKQEKMQLDYRAIWSRQTVPEELADLLEDLAPKVADIIKDSPETVRNVLEYCKKQVCWATVQTTIKADVKRRLKACIVDLDEIAEQKKDDKKSKIMDDGIDAQKRVFEISGPEWSRILAEGQKKRIYSLKEAGILKAATQIPNKLPSEKQCIALVEILEKAEEEGIVVNG